MVRGLQPRSPELLRPLRIFPREPKFDFVGRRRVAFALTLLAMAAAAAALAARGLNLGLDFTGGVVVEAAAPRPVDLAPLRARLGGLGLGEVQLQHFGSDRDVLIRVQPAAEGRERNAASAVRAALGEAFEIRRVEAVGPTVSRELLRDGVIATLLAVAGIGLYVAFRFEWQFGAAGLLATAHDVFVTLGLFALLGAEFNMAAIACLLTLAGYSINDTVVVFDRIRENLRKHRRMPIPALINLSVNETLTRTLTTSVTTALAVLALLLFGGHTLRGFSAGLLFGIVVGTYSSIYVAAALLLYMPPLRSAGGRGAQARRSPRR
jgi:preprotein translocase subunit SecF